MGLVFEVIFRRLLCARAEAEVVLEHNASRRNQRIKFVEFGFGAGVPVRIEIHQRDFLRSLSLDGVEDVTLDEPNVDTVAYVSSDLFFRNTEESPMPDFLCVTPVAVIWLGVAFKCVVSPNSPHL